ncbi:YCF48-related protein [Flavobacterium sp. MMS24-S5]|uniref:YCF48-related protein n=1 Tax=Flavobacterium sp. MMS24-S5 TaxID=3416605 RepID=UPI003CFBCDC4
MIKKLLLILCLFLSANTILSQTNWELLNPKPTVNTGKKVKFVSSTVGYILTSDELLQTEDAGNSWKKKLTLTASSNDINFFNNLGFIVGDLGYVLKTTDSGNSWTKISTGFNVSFNTVNVINSTTIILSSSNSIVKSTDGGITWTSLSIPNVDVNKTFFNSELIGHAACKNGKMLKTIDGGQNWYVTQSTNVFPSDFFTVYFINEKVGFSSQQHSKVFKTTDGGETWIEITGISQAIYDFYFLNENIGFVTGDSGATFRTENGGITWSQIFFQKGYIYNTSMYGIYFENSDIGYATGARGRIIKTVDGGKTWKENSFTYNLIKKIQMFNDGTGYFETGQIFYKTVDNGNSWSQVGSVKHYEYCSGFYFVNKNVGYSIGGGTTSISGDVYKTIDGGLTWNKLSISVDEGLSSVFFTDENTGFISGGFNRKIALKTIDGGITWSQVSNNEYGKIQFVNSQIGYGNRIGYSTGFMYKTTDGGNTWKQSIEVEDDIVDFDFVDADNGYFTGDQGLLYKTNDGGKTWKKLTLPFAYYTIIKFYSKNVGYVAEDYGKIYKTVNGGESWELLTTQFGIRSIEIASDKIFRSGENGRLYRSDVEYDDVSLEALTPVVKNSIVTLNGNVTSNKGEISNIRFEYYNADYSSYKIMNAIPEKVDANESLNVFADITNFAPNTTYYFRILADYNSKTYTSKILSFTTLPNYTITDLYPNCTTNSAQLTAEITSNYNDISSIEFQYGLQNNVLDKTISANPSLVHKESTESITSNLTDLKPNTAYFYRIKAKHQGEVIYGNTVSFTTKPEYTFFLYGPYIQENTVTFTSYITANTYDITDLVLEYGTLNYEKNVPLSLSKITANSTETVTAQISNLDPNSFYYFRLKGNYNGNTIYSNEAVFNISGKVIMASGKIENKNESIVLKGLVNSNGYYLTNIQFEYGLTDSFGNSIATNPSFIYGNGTTIVTSSINNPLPNQTYYYRIVANQYGTKIYSDTYQYKTSSLNVGDFSNQKNIIIYPNPVADFLTIKLNNEEKIDTLEMYNLNGQKVILKNKVVNPDDIKIDVRHFTKGLYILKLNFENNKVSYKKIIVN